MNKLNIHRLSEILLGSRDEFPMEHRFLSAFMLFSAIFSLSAVVMNSFINVPKSMVAWSAISTVSMAIFYYFSRFRNLYTPVLYISTVFVLVMLSIIWIENAGSKGPVIYIFFALLVFIILFFRGIMGIGMISIFTLTIILLFVLEKLYPEMITPYVDEEIRTIHHISTLIPMIMIISFFIYYTIQYYLREKEKAQQSDVLKSSFLSNMSHEIRTPMNGILGFSQLLINETDPKVRSNYVNIINESGDSLLNLINDILDISEIESGQGKIVYKAFDLHKLLDELCDTFNEQKGKLNKNKVEIVLELPDSYSVKKLLSDPFRLKQILSNLINNALKFTESGSITFGYKKQLQNKLLFFVRDTGIGISKEKQEIIFNRFLKIEDSFQKLYRGAGLGLSISKQLVGLLGGNIWVESEPGKGSVFMFTLPLEEAELVEIIGEKKISHEDIFSWEGKKLLIAEDEELNYKLFFEMFKPTGIDLYRAENGKIALDMYREKKDFDIIILDLKMPEMDGIQVFKRIREENKKVPILAVTAFGLEEEKQKCENIGFNKYFSKPVNKNELFTAIDQFIK